MHSQSGIYDRHSIHDVTARAMYVVLSATGAHFCEFKSAKILKFRCVENLRIFLLKLPVASSAWS